MGECQDDRSRAKITARCDERITDRKSMIIKPNREQDKVMKAAEPVKISSRTRGNRSSVSGVRGITR